MFLSHLKSRLEGGLEGGDSEGRQGEGNDITRRRQPAGGHIKSPNDLSDLDLLQEGGKNRQGMYTGEERAE